MSTPEEVAAGLKRAAEELGSPDKLMQQVVYLVQRRVQQRTRVDTGTLRRSMYAKVVTAQKGMVGSNRLMNRCECRRGPGADANQGAPRRVARVRSRARQKRAS